MLVFKKFTIYLKFNFNNKYKFELIILYLYQLKL